MAKTNRTVVTLWTRGEPCEAGNLSTDGRELFSYALRIGTTGETGEKIAIDYSGRNRVSQTTSRHVGLARLAATRTVSPDAAPRVRMIGGRR